MFTEQGKTYALTSTSDLESFFILLETTQFKFRHIVNSAQLNAINFNIKFQAFQNRSKTIYWFISLSLPSFITNQADCLFGCMQVNNK